jgi:RNA polymerase sigma-70 factor (ECF subfamily)
MAHRDIETEQFIHQLFLSWYSPLVRYAAGLTGSVQAAEDIVQQGFLALHDALLRDEAISNPKGWLLCVIRREACRLARRDRRNAEVLESTDELDKRPGGESDTALGSDELSRLMAVLTPREEEIILLRMQALRYREIASQLNISVNSVKTLLARALKKMRLEARGGGRARTLEELDDISEVDDIAQAL